MGSGGTGGKVAAANGDRVATHLWMIQGVISRMGQNAFATKTWAVTIMAAVFALGPLTGRSTLDGWALILPLLIVWVMDAYFMRQEHLFRRLYDAAARGEVGSFSMNTGPYESGVVGLPAYVLAHGVWPLHAISVTAVALRALKG